MPLKKQFILNSTGHPVLARTVRCIIAVTLLQSYSCRCDKEHTYYLTPVSRHYFSDFSEGSYWIFENYNDTTDMDTLTLQKKTAGFEFMYTESTCDGDYYETVRYQLLSTKTNDTLHVTVTTNLNIDHYSIQGRFHDIILSSSIIFKKKKQAFSVNYHAKDTLNLYDSYILRNRSYNDVVRMTFKYDHDFFPDQASTLYFSKHVGLILFSSYDKASNTKRGYWLKDYYIVK